MTNGVGPILTLAIIWAILVENVYNNYNLNIWRYVNFCICCICWVNFNLKDEVYLVPNSFVQYIYVHIYTNSVIKSFLSNLFLFIYTAYCKMINDDLHHELESRYIYGYNTLYENLLINLYLLIFILMSW